MVGFCGLMEGGNGKEEGVKMLNKQGGKGTATGKKERRKEGENSYDECV